MQALFNVFFGADLWTATLQWAALFLLPALGGVISERSGVTNIGLEGMMLVGCFAGVMAARAANNVFIGITFAVLAGMAIALIHAVISINFKANQVVSGIAINIAALGLTSYLLFVMTNNQGVPSIGDSIRLKAVDLGPLSTLPFIGPVLLHQNIMFYVTVVLLIGMQFLLFRTNAGLRIRAVGEHPEAADTAGVNVYLIRYVCVLASGALAGLAGAYLALGINGIFNANMTAGAGFIGLAAVVFGKYIPWGAAGACLIFGLGQALAPRLQNETHISPYLLSTLPYVLTLIALVGLVGRTTPPAADGVPYDPAEE